MQQIQHIILKRTPGRPTMYLSKNDGMGNYSWSSQPEKAVIYDGFAFAISDARNVLSAMDMDGVSKTTPGFCIESFSRHPGILLSTPVRWDRWRQALTLANGELTDGMDDSHLEQIHNCSLKPSSAKPSAKPNVPPQVNDGRTTMSISLRDWRAMMVMRTFIEMDGCLTFEDAAKRAYRAADALEAASKAGAQCEG